MDRTRQIECLNTMPGLAGDIAREIYECQYKKQPALAIQSALCIMSCLKAQIRVGPTFLGCNLYTVGTAGPGKGKDKGLEYAAQLFDRLQLTDIYNYGVGSSVGFIEGLKAGACNSLLLWDEFGKDMSHILDERGAHPYLKAIAHELMKLYSRSKGSYSPQIVSGHSGRGNYRFYRPNVTICGVTVPEPLFNSIKEMHIMDGLLPRFLYFKGLERPEACRLPRLNAPSNKIVEACKYYKNGTLLSRQIFNGQNFITEVGDITHVGDDKEPPQVKFTKGSVGEYEWICDKVEETIDTIGGFSSHLYGRLVENVLKVAVIINDGETLSKDSLDWAHWLVQDTIVDFIGDIDKNTADSLFEKSINKARKFFAIQQTITPSAFAAHMKMELRRAKDILEYLIKIKAVKVVKLESGELAYERVGG